MPCSSATRIGSQSSSREGPKPDHPTTRFRFTKTKVARTPLERICAQNCSHWSTESCARSSSGTMPAYAACHERTCTLAIPPASRSSASRVIIILCRFIPEGPNSVRVTFSHFRNLISESSELGTDLNSQDDEVDSFRWSGRTPSGVGIRISALKRKSGKRLGVGIL